jgi:subtilase family serine protease
MMKWFLLSMTALALGLTVSGSAHAQAPLPSRFGLPDLVVTRVTALPFSTQAFVTVRNQGLGRAPASTVQVRSFLPGLLPDVRTVAVPPLASGQSVTLAVNMGPSRLRPDTRLLATVDPIRQVRETNEFNNTTEGIVRLRSLPVVLR